MNKKRILVCGSIAYDHLMSFDGSFKDEIIPGKMEAFSLSFTVKERKTFFGGCAGNIGFHLKKIGGDPLIIGYAGTDFASYEKWLQSNGVSTEHLIRSDRLPTSAAFVTNDIAKKQLTIFDAGAAGVFTSHNKLYIKKTVRAHASAIAMAIVAPNHPAFISECATTCTREDIPYIFDPGQVTPLFSRQELIRHTKNAFGLILNEYEYALFQRTSDLSIQEILRLCKFFVETRGEKGSVIYTQTETFTIPAYKPKKVVDPTGCGDAYRAGFLQELVRTNLSLKSLQKAGRKGALLARAVVSKIGTQV